MVWLLKYKLKQMAPTVILSKDHNLLLILYKYLFFITERERKKKETIDKNAPINSN